MVDGPQATHDALACRGLSAGHRCTPPSPPGRTAHRWLGHPGRHAPAGPGYGGTTSGGHDRASTPPTQHAPDPPRSCRLRQPHNPHRNRVPRPARTRTQPSAVTPTGGRDVQCRSQAIVPGPRLAVPSGSHRSPGPRLSTTKSQRLRNYANIGCLRNYANHIHTPGRCVWSTGFA